jgi:PAS domain S-box-containing protein
MSADVRQDQTAGIQLSPKPELSGPGDPVADAEEDRSRFQAIFEGVETGIFIIDPETHRIIDANPVAVNLAGAPHDKIIGGVCHKFVCPAEKGHCPVTDLGQTVDNSERVLLTIGGKRRSIIKTVKPVQMAGRQYLLESFLDITERKRSEKALEERTAYLDSLIETSPLGIVVLDKDEHIQLSNTAFEKLFLYSREEMQGARLSELIIPPGLISEGDRFTRVCLSGGSTNFATRRRRKDNALVDVQVYGVPLVIAGELQGILALYQDIGERTRIQAGIPEHHRLATLAGEIGLALTGAEGLSQGLQECVDALVRNMDIAFAQIWTANEKEHRLELRASADIQLAGGSGRKYMNMSRIDSIARSGVMQLDSATGTNAAAAGGAGQSGLLSFVGYPLKVREQVLGVAAAFVTQPITDATTQAIESVVHGVAQFVERNRAEDSLRESEDRFRTAFEEAPHGMCLTAPDGRFLHANAALCQILGYSSEELLAGAWQQITHPDDLERSRQVALRFSCGEITSFELEKRYVHKQGHVIWVRLKISVVKNDCGSPSHFITQIEDITQRKLADEAQAFLASLVESSQDAIAGTTPDGIVVSWNRGAAELSVIPLPR